MSTSLSLQALFALTGVSLLLSATCLRVLLFFKIKKQNVYLVSFLLFLISFISFSGHSINIYLRGAVNDLSITTLIVLTYYLIKPSANRTQTYPLFFLIVIIGLFFYPTALGVGPVDPYSWGFINKDHGLFNPILFLILLAAIMLFALIKNHSLLLLSIVLSLLTYQFGLLESRNLWDYLFDPLIFIYSLITILYHWLSSSTLNKSNILKPDKDN